MNIRIVVTQNNPMECTQLTLELLYRTWFILIRFCIHIYTHVHIYLYICTQTCFGTKFTHTHTLKNTLKTHKTVAR